MSDEFSRGVCQGYRLLEEIVAELIDGENPK